MRGRLHSNPTCLTCTSFGDASMNACTVAFMPGICLMPRSVRSRRIARSADSPERYTHSSGSSPSSETIVTKKSIQFHPSAR